MTFDFNNAWVLQSIYFSERPGQGALLKDIIAYADYVNHAIMSYEELRSAISKLKEVGLVTETDKILATTEPFNMWWLAKYGSKKRYYPLKGLYDIELFLNKSYKDYPVPVEMPETAITKEDFEMAVKEYLGQAFNLLSHMPFSTNP